MPTPQLEIPGDCYWDLVFHYKNPDNVTVERTEIVRWSRKVSKSAFKEQTEEIASKLATEHKAGLEAGGSYSIVSASVRAETGISAEINSTISKVSRIEAHEELEESGESQHTYRLGPGSSYSLYQRVFYAPGVIVKTQTYSGGPGEEVPGPKIHVPITCDLRPNKFLSDIEASYLPPSL
ncbi:hypothetical protein T310_1039 [Rasamsonia emersonii CBS 393.64]|uniref:Uncharacterized protein n=1 Tax=Rasamsonia emersonii (strain ATCC 16479 / CBS 393.64 / IMI 116815) TaxID=1408163 RepID=A0A0F4Z320_RASE3|nr:hypothetical protein T310_1039 [Rasamsonia emersonii CBS 393.64]KKA24924.1 hypothetical protein T310_1039 [Rasamsonia emersonii CBS 393.64]